MLSFFNLVPEGPSIQPNLFREKSELTRESKYTYISCICTIEFCNNYKSLSKQQDTYIYIYTHTHTHIYIYITCFLFIEFHQLHDDSYILYSLKFYQAFQIIYFLKFHFFPPLIIVLLNKRDLLIIMQVMLTIIVLTI